MDNSGLPFWWRQYVSVMRTVDIYADDMESLMTPANVSERIGVPSTTLAQWRYLKKGPAYIKVGNHVRYRLDDLLVWEEAHRCVPANG